RKQAEAAFRHGGDGRGGAPGLAEELGGLTGIGGGFPEEKKISRAAAVYEGIPTAPPDNLHTRVDTEGDPPGVVSACVEGLEKCLKTAKDDPERRLAILRTFFDVYRFDIDQGGIGLSDNVPDLVEETTPEERRVIAGWVREVLPKGKDF